MVRNGLRKSEVGSRQKSEVRSPKTEVGSRKSEVGSPSSAFVHNNSWNYELICDRSQVSGATMRAGSREGYMKHIASDIKSNVRCFLALLEVKTRCH